MAAKASLSEETFATAWSAGRGLSWNQAVIEAVALAQELEIAQRSTSPVS